MTLLGIEALEHGSGTARAWPGPPGIAVRAGLLPYPLRGLLPGLLPVGPASPTCPLHVTHAPIVASPSDIMPPASPGDDSPGRGRWIRT